MKKTKVSCPKCEDDMTWVEINRSSEYWYCRACKKEYDELLSEAPKPSGDSDFSDAGAEGDTYSYGFSYTPGCYSSLPSSVQTIARARDNVKSPSQVFYFNYDGQDLIESQVPTSNKGSSNPPPDML